MERMRRKTGWAGGILAVVLSLPGCSTDLAKTGKADVLLEITQITGQTENGGTAGTAASVLLSDVLFKGGVFNDNANISMICIPKNPNSALATNDFQAVSLDSYEVHYTRADGRNTEGIDVPFSISGAMSGFVPVTIGTAVTPSIVAIIVVRHQAKFEPPLSLLAHLGQGELLTTIATITVHGHTLAGQEVSATGQLEIVFADFADGS